jgi:hypothetical protein
VKCQNCSEEHNRRRFCSNRCKDQFHNRTNPRGFTVESTVTESAEIDDDEAAKSGAFSGWDEGGWLSDDSGVSSI